MPAYKKCERCGTGFKPRSNTAGRFCSRACSAQVLRAKTYLFSCRQCGKEFTATLDHGRKRAYCSKECRQQLRKERTCVQCGKIYTIHQSTARRRPTEGCCSGECQAKFYAGANNRNWKGGKYVDSIGGRIMLLEGSNKYRPEHRVIADKIIGRRLLPSEKVLHINSVPTDNRPENLFVCSSNSQMIRIINGVLPYPTKSNLDTYK